MAQDVSSISGQFPVSVGSCSLTAIEQLQYAGIALTTLLLLVVLVRSLTSFVKAVRN